MIRCTTVSGVHVHKKIYVPYIRRVNDALLCYQILRKGMHSNGDNDFWYVLHEKLHEKVVAFYIVYIRRKER